MNTNLYTLLLCSRIQDDSRIYSEILGDHSTCENKYKKKKKHINIEPKKLNFPFIRQFVFIQKHYNPGFR